LRVPKSKKTLFPKSAISKHISLNRPGRLPDVALDSYPFAATFLKGLGEAGYVDGSNVTIGYRWERRILAAASGDRLDTLY
jgi:hypothetical protein